MRNAVAAKRHTEDSESSNVELRNKSDRQYFTTLCTNVIFRSPVESLCCVKFKVKNAEAFQTVYKHYNNSETVASLISQYHSESQHAHLQMGFTLN